jgi:branched-chain amino acid transport system ATP-binding protein
VESGSAILEVKDVTRRFGGLLAVDGVSFSVGKGEIMALIGPNGAGKTTLFNVVSGRMRSSSGTVTLAGRNVERTSLKQRVRLGIAATYQIPKQLGELTVGEILQVAQHYGQTGERTSEELAEICDDLGLNTHEVAGTLDLHRVKHLEIARAIATSPSVLLLDEIAAGLDDTEVSTVAEHVRRLAAAGTTIVVVEHRMDFLVSMCNRVVVLNFGKVLFDGSIDEALANQAVVEAYLGSAHGAA